ncbi:MAG: TatD family hydrolase [Gemmatimonadetes bacterium]|nr:TatD family hydrolase [Gemmatimonadota bacterium]
MFDSHCHLTDGRFDEDRAAVLDAALQAGVTRIVTVASDLEDARAAAELAENHADLPRSPAADLPGSHAGPPGSRAALWSTAGIHPHEVSDTDDADLAAVRELAATHPRVVAIGETGLDYFYEHSPRELQRRWFEAQLEVAADLDLPVVIHTREAEDDTIAVLRNAPESVLKVLHCFTGSMKLLEVGLEEGCYVSFAGIITFSKFDGQEAVRAVPEDRLLAETDAPYLAPVPRRGKRNEPAFVTHVVAALADIRGESVGAVAEATAQNAERFYALSDHAAND